MQVRADTHYFCKIRDKAIYWYLIEMIAVQLKTGELRNPKIYEFNPDVVYNCTTKNHEPRTKNQEPRTSSNRHSATREKDIEENNLTKLSHLQRRTSINFPQRSNPPASLLVCLQFMFSNAKSTSSPDSSATSALNRTDIQIKH
jgi:hypothetical protein